MLCHGRVGNAEWGVTLTDESLLAEGVPLADGAPLDIVLRRGGVL